MRHVPERFQIVRRLGAGGFGIVYEAIDRERGERVALKALARVGASALYRFKREFRALADVTHDNLVRLHELIGSGDEWFFTMELVRGVDWLTHVRGQGAAGGAASWSSLTSTAPPDEGIDLDATLEEPVERPPAPSPAGAACAEARADADLKRVRSSLVQVARALQAVHAARLVHRDVKPSNVLVTAEGRAIVLDFGIASRLSTSGSGQSATDAEQLVGTPRYMAPEQVGASAAAPSADWYALGVMLFEALAGRPPFTGTSIEVLAEKQRSAPPRLRDVAPWAPDDLADLVADLLCAAPERRPSGAEVVRRLGAAGDLAAAPPDPAAPVGRGGRGPSRAAVEAPATRPRELEALAGALARVREGQPGLVLVQGAAAADGGALVRAFLDGEAGDALVLEGRCHEREQVPFRALDGVIDALSRHLVRTPPGEAAALMPRGAAALARVFPVLARVPAVRASPPLPAPRSGAEEGEERLRARASAALRDLLGRISDRRAVVVFIDDAHGGDAESASLLAEIMASPDPAALLLIVAYRPEDAGASPLLSALRTSPAMAAVHTVEIDLTGTPARRSPPGARGS
ncbi:protein kinase domain-containing protein [Sorangium sp. So ce117]|uniref:serine/threonine-protein kinase n=1 Tax=Sorangium sp. So ce117 TaxID=3133277 RepID=UPI003F5E349C